MPGPGLVAPPCQPGDQPAATHPGKPARTLGPAQPFGSCPGAEAVPRTPAPLAGVLGALRASSPLPAGRAALPSPAGLAGIAFGVLLLGVAFLLFITLQMLPSCQPRASQPWDSPGGALPG